MHAVVLRRIALSAGRPVTEAQLLRDFEEYGIPQAEGLQTLKTLESKGRIVDTGKGWADKPRMIHT